LQGVWGFFLVKIWLKMGFFRPETDQSNLREIEGRWNLGKIGDVSPANFFKNINERMTCRPSLKKIRPRRVGCSKPTHLRLFIDAQEV